ncbi:MAG: dsDNA nuclease domain-containing protein [Gammaproteobacteria bacterium]|nr:dsDNA nuclease domain-containing protein [Gammaproteobacteria bacterium]MDP2346384.1 dsDNA nuclease domain-containing protein [Gammaproteobacteria bacterium]
MPVTIQSDLITVPQTETAGSNSPARFAYQRNWALAELIEYHLEGKDYVFAFEFHDDVLILDSEKNPSELQFIQVKTKTTGKKWSIHELTKSEKGKGGNPDKLSIIGKLYENKKNFAVHSSRLRFVTNAYFSFASPAPVIVADQLDEEVQGKITSAVQSQLGTGLVDLSCFQLEQSSLSVDDHEKHIRGILHNFFDKLFGGKHNIAVSPWYQAISDQIKIKNNYPSVQIKTFEELIRNKCITKSEIEDFVQRVNRARSNCDNWDIIKAQLQKEDVTLQELVKLHRAWQKYTSDRLDYDNSALKSLESDIAIAVNSIPVSENPALKDVISAVRKFISKKLETLANIFDSDYINSVILWQYCEKL